MFTSKKRTDSIKSTKDMNNTLSTLQKWQDQMEALQRASEAREDDKLYASSPEQGDDHIRIWAEVSSANRSSL